LDDSVVEDEAKRTREEREEERAVPLCPSPPSATSLVANSFSVLPVMVSQGCYFGNSFKILSFLPSLSFLSEDDLS